VWTYCNIVPRKFGRNTFHETLYRKDDNDNDNDNDSNDEKDENEKLSKKVLRIQKNYITNTTKSFIQNNGVVALSSAY
jgi:hypothetical protein